jgi:thiol-disulfide isomerase/thioredoxin
VSRRIALVAVAVALGLAGCTGPDPVRTAEPASVFEICPPTTTAAAPSGDPATAVPAVTLPCLRGGAPVNLAGLGGPAVINLWSSYCQPCRTELPVLQGFADAHRGEVLVLGVVTADVRARAVWAAHDLGVRFPSVEDTGRRLLTALGRTALPVTLFVDAGGNLRHLDATGGLTPETLEALTRRYLAPGAPGP